MKNKKTNSEFIIDALMSGDAMRSPDITAKVAELSGKEVKIQDVASILAKLSNSEKCDLGYIISKTKGDRGFVYNMVKEASELEPEQIYDLTRKTGKDRFTIDDAVKKVPTLKKYIKSAKNRQVPKVLGRPAGKSGALTSKGVEVSDAALKGVLSEFMKEIIFQGGLNVNVHLTVHFKGIA